MLKFNGFVEKFDMNWYQTYMPQELVDIILQELPTTFNVNQNTLDYGVVGSETTGTDVDKSFRKSKVNMFNADNWIGALCYYFIKQANDANFRYNIGLFDNNRIQYTSYCEGEYYNWHNDEMRYADGSIRKLSFTLQLSDPSEYEGGDVQILESSSNELLIMPKERGSITIFDSRLKHRVKKVTKGFRQSLVGWVIGPSFV